MSFVQWVGAGLGWAFGGPIGAVLGWVVGNVLDSGASSFLEEFEGTKKSKRPKKIYSKRSSSSRSQRREEPRTSSGDFEISLLMLSAIVIKADGKTDQKELDYVRQQFVSMYGKQRANNAFKLFNGIMKKKGISTRQICMQIQRNMDHPSRLQLLHYLFGIAQADGHVAEEEVNTIRKMAGYLYINLSDFESIKAMFFSDTNNAYKILEIEKSATDDEVKKAFRTMAKKYHPDKVQHLGEEHMKGAEEKFRKVKQAYEQIQQERGF
ncbi:TerB family tellurite resistance protein [Spongiivirga sp. MCCC 1A20706]|uniref:TerB family tellurite resistance protein n=1 Tax=Spongiivirga sp. MCCC 1A20706 TaxID=3160963 RepID=UPI0039777E2B